MCVEGEELFVSSLGVCISGKTGLCVCVCVGRKQFVHLTGETRECVERDGGL